MSKKLSIVLALVMIATLVLSACAPAATATPAPAEPTAAAPVVEPTKAPEPVVEPTKAPEAAAAKVTIWHAWKENEIASLNDVIAAYKIQNPGVEVEVLYVPFDDLKGKYETAASTGAGPTVLIGGADWGPGFYNSELVENIKDTVNQDLLKTINPAALGAVTYKDAIIGLPETIKGVVMFRNKTLVPEPYADFAALLADKKAALEYGVFFSSGHLYGLGGKLMTPEGDPAFNDENGVKWVELIKSFKDANAEGKAFIDSDDDVALFKAGQAGVIIDGTWNISNLAETIGMDNLAIDPWPAPLSGFVQTENIYLNPNAADADKAAGLKFLEFFLSKEAQALLADPAKAAHIPAVADVEVSDPLMKQAAEAFAGGTAFPVIPEMGAYWDAMKNALVKVVDTDADPAATLQEAFDAVTAKVKEIRGN